MKVIQTLITRFQTLGRYGIVAGGSWIIDTGVLYVLAQCFKFPVFLSSIAGVLCGACFNYFFSTHLIFDSGKVFCWRKLGFFIAYILVTMLLWSAIITWLVGCGLWIVAAKVAIVPITFYTNFLFMGWLQEGRPRWC